MSSLRTSPEWSLLIYRVSGDVQQQAILCAFRLIAWPGVTVLGTQDGSGHFVIVDCGSTTYERRARQLILGIDGSAVRSLRAGMRLTAEA